MGRQKKKARMAEMQAAMKNRDGKDEGGGAKSGATSVAAHFMKTGAKTGFASANVTNMLSAQHRAQAAKSGGPAKTAVPVAPRSKALMQMQAQAAAPSPVSPEVNAAARAASLRRASRAS